MAEERSGVAFVRATQAEKSARLSSYARLGSPLPEKQDQRGEGVVDFENNRVVMTDRLITPRMTKRGPAMRLLYSIFERAVAGGQEVLFEGGSVRRRTDSNSPWGDTRGTIGGPKYPFDPLCVFPPILASNVEGVLLGAGMVRGVEVEEIELKIPRSGFDPEVWAEIAGGGRTEQMDEAFVTTRIWADTGYRMHRVAFESKQGTSPADTLWSITELWEFGARS